MEIQFTKEELINAIKQINNDPELLIGRHSSTYDLIYKDKTYPPILVLSLANEAKNKRKLTLLDFNNNVEIPFKILREHGFEIKQKSVVENHNNKGQFKKWVLDNLTEKSGAGPAYITSIDWLSNRFYENDKIPKKSIFEIEDVELITKLHSEVKNIQRDNTSYIYNKDAPSYGERYFYSASLSKYKEFLLTKNNNQPPEQETTGTTISNEKFKVDSFSDQLYHSGLAYSKQLITRFTSSILTKPFVILTGLSGSGKTKLAQSFAQWICENKDQYCIVPVGADWTNREPLLGYVNALDDREYIKPENGALTLILEANNNLHKPYFLILDEMNLSHVERYFADFLSIMESKENFKLHNDAGNSKSDIPHELSWPNNLFVVGTVNIDETTYMFSPKVLDRANVIEFRVNDNEIKDFLESAKEITGIDGLGKTMGASFVEIAEKKPSHGNLENLNKELLNFFNDLQKLGAEFGYRTGYEIQTLFSKIDLINPEYADREDEKIDIAIMQKLLPKLHGSRRKLIKTLELLAQKCLIMDAGKIFNEKGESLILPDNIKYKLSFEKISRMYKNIIENGFTSYAEA